MLRLPRPRLGAVSHVTPAALSVGGEGGAPDALRRRELGAVTVGDGGVEAAPAVDIHAGPEPVDVGGE